MKMIPCQFDENDICTIHGSKRMIASNKCERIIDAELGKFMDEGDRECEQHPSGDGIFSGEESEATKDAFNRQFKGRY
jgi:hypothetical protein